MVNYGCLGNFKPSTFFCQHSVTLTWAVLRYKPEHGTSRISLESNESKESAVSSNSGLRRPA